MSVTISDVVILITRNSMEGGEGSPVLDTLKSLESWGVCVGVLGSMTDMLLAQSRADKVITL